jgi:hypothetical protein
MKLQTPQKINTEIKSILQTKQETKQQLETKQMLRTKQLSFTGTKLSIKPFKINQIPTPIIKAFPLLSKSKKSKQSMFGNIKIPKFNQKRAYNPSLVAREFNIKGTASRLDKMGFGIQPI